MHTDKNVCCADSMFTLNDFDSDSDFDLDEQTTARQTFEPKVKENARTWDSSSELDIASNSHKTGFFRQSLEKGWLSQIIKF